MAWNEQTVSQIGEILTEEKLLNIKKQAVN